MLDRFPDDIGDELLRRAGRLRIDLLRLANGQVCSIFELTGAATTHSVFSEDHSTIQTQVANQAEDLRFLRSLMKAFQERDAND